MALKITYAADAPPLSVIAAAKFIGAECIRDSSLPSGSSPSLIFPDGLQLRGVNVLLRYFGRIGEGLYGQNALEASQIDEWLEYSAILASGPDFENACANLDKFLLQRTLFVGFGFSIADIAIWAGLTGTGQRWESLRKSKKYQNLVRWYNSVSSEYSSVLQEVASLVVKKGLDCRSEMKRDEKKMKSSWKQKELIFLIIYAVAFYFVVIQRTLQLSSDYYGKLYGLRYGWLAGRFNDASDAQWRNFRSNLPILTVVFGLYSMIAQILRISLKLKVRGMSLVWLVISLTYLIYLHGACIIFILSIAFLNYLLVKISARTKYFSFLIWVINISFLICNRVFEGYAFSEIGQPLAYLDHYRGTFRWQICFNFVVLRMISYGYDYHWAHKDSPKFDLEKHAQRCHTCKSGHMCYVSLQERSVPEESYSLFTYLSYLVFAPLYLAGPIISFNAFASQLDTPQNNYSSKMVALYGLRWVLNLLLMELMTHFCLYNAFAISGLWKQLSPFDVFIIGYGVLNFMWLKFLLIWRYFRLWSLISGIEPPENMPKCINNCYNLESFWKNWHSSFNKWLVRYMYIPLGGSRRKLVNVWVVFTFVAVWHDLEWKLLSWAWLTCLFFIPEVIVKSAASSFQAESAFGKFIHRELHALAGAITITCLMVANLVGYVIGPSGMNWLVSRFLNREGLPILGGMFMTFYVGTKLMLHIQDMKTKDR